MTYPNPTIKSAVGLTGNATAVTQSALDNSTKIATTAYVDTRPYLNDQASTGNITIPASTTIFIPIQGFSSNCISYTSDATGGTQSLVTRTTTFQNAYWVASVNPGTAKCTITLMTNGTAASITGGPSAGTTANDTTHTNTVVAGVEVGWRIAIASGATAAKYELAIEGK